MMQNRFFFSLLCLICCWRFVQADLVENTAYQGEKTRIRWAFWGGQEAIVIYKTIAEKFVQEHPEIAIDIAIYPWGQYWTKLQTQVASGLAPDIISMVGSGAGLWINHGALRPLDTYIETSHLDLADYFPVSYETFRWYDKIYAFPLEMPVGALVYNIDRLEERGIPPEEWPKTDEAMSWEAYKALAQKLTIHDNKGNITQYGNGSVLWWFDTIYSLYGGDFYDRRVNPTKATVVGNEPLINAIIESYQDRFGHIIQASIPILGSSDFQTDLLLRSPKFSMSFLGTWALKPLKDAGVRFGITPLPQGTVPNMAASVNGLSIYTGSKHPDEAWLFIQYLASKPSQELMAKSLRSLPVIKTATDAILQNDFGIDGLEAYLEHLEIAQPYLSATNVELGTIAFKWCESLEYDLQAYYDQKLHALQASHESLTDTEFEAFSSEMNQYVEQEIRKRIPKLQASLDAGFARLEKKPTSFFISTILPLLIVLVLVSAFVTYVVWIRRNRDDTIPVSTSNNKTAYMMLSPWLIGFTIFTLGPILASIYLSFTEWNMVKPPDWVGAQHFANLFEEPYFLLGLQKTFTYALFVIPISLIGGILTAGLLTSDLKGADSFKAIFYFPSLFTGAAAAVIWVNMFHREYGVVNEVLSWFGNPPIYWLDEQHAFLTVVLMNFFWVGGATIIYYAGMKQIPRSYYEAAAIDGAGLFSRFFLDYTPLAISYHLIYGSDDHHRCISSIYASLILCE